MEENEPKALRPKSVERPTKFVFHDFDYINPLTNLPEGSKLGDYDEDNNPTESSPGRISSKLFGLKLMNQSVSMGKSVYVSERGEVPGKAGRLGGKKQHLRALQNVEPFMKNINGSAHRRFNSIQVEESYSKKNIRSSIPKPLKAPTSGRKILKPLINKNQMKKWIPTGGSTGAYASNLKMRVNS